MSEILWPIFRFGPGKTYGRYVDHIIIDNQIFFTRGVSQWGFLIFFFFKIDSSACNEQIRTVQVLKFRIFSLVWRKTIIDSGQKLPESENQPERAIFTIFPL